MKKLIVKSMACAVAVGSMAAAHQVMALETEAQSANAPIVQAPTPDAAQKPEAMKVSENGFSATRAMHAARVAIFNGDPKLCEEMLTRAQKALEMAALDDSVAKVKTDLIPIDGSLALADTFVPSDEKAEFVMKANQHFQNGDPAKGMEQLKLGEIEVRFSRILMPLESTQQRLAEAISLAKEQKFYDANLALKAAGEGLEFDSVSLIEFPKAAESEAKQG